MPTRLVVWNINRFSINTINDTRGDTELERLDAMEQSWQNLFFIENIARQADIFVVIEVQSSRASLGSLIGASGKLGVLSLLTSLRQDLNANWCLVPPLKLAGPDESATGVDADNVYTEGIGVFFRADKLNFTGPYVWPTTGGVASPPFGNVTPGPYPKSWANALPVNNFFAGQPQFFKNPGQQTGQIYFTTAKNRRPFLTSFTEIATQRKIVMLAVHPTPGAGTETAVARISSILEIQPQRIPQVVAVVGDFNVNVHKVDAPVDVYSFFGKQKKSKSTTLSGSAYQQLKNIGLTQLFRTDTPGTNGVTFIEPIDKATPQAYLTNLGLDNIFLRYDGGLQPPNNIVPLIIDPVTGTDGVPSDMLQSLDFIKNSEAFQDDDARDAAFRKTYNYGHIAHFRGVSDHLPLFVTI